MQFMGIALLLKGILDFVGRVMEGRKTKTGLGLVAIGTGVSAFSVWGVDIAPDQVLNVIKQVLGLFGYQVTGIADAAAQSLLGNLINLIGAGIALYGYFKKGEAVSKS